MYALRGGIRNFKSLRGFSKPTSFPSFRKKLQGRAGAYLCRDIQLWWTGVEFLVLAEGHIHDCAFR